MTRSNAPTIPGWLFFCRPLDKSGCHLQEDIVFGVLVATKTPHFHTLSVFRNPHLAQLSDLFRQMLALCQRAGLVKLVHWALDSTEVKTNASHHLAMSLRRMMEKKAQWKAELNTFLQQAQVVDAAECRQHGPTRRKDERPVKLALREGRLQKLKWL